MARSTCFEKSRLLLDLMVDARFNHTSMMMVSIIADGDSNDDIAHNGDDVQGSSSSS